MPLVVVTGYPCSGKTTWAKRLKSELERRILAAKANSDPGYNYKVTYYSDETFGITHDVYGDSTKEKIARGSQISAVKRDLSKNNIVILDSMAYIKGFRYQLYCESKGMATSHCVLHVIAPLDKCLEWNAKVAQQVQWDVDIMKQLQMRYEEPNRDAKWDSPLFEVTHMEGDLLPMDEIWNALVLKKAPVPNAATTIQSTSDNSFLQELDRRTHEVISTVLQQQQLTGGRVQIDKDLIVTIPMGTASTAQLQRIRRSFISLNRMRTIERDRIIPFFVDYLDRSLNNED
ncbi:KTI12 [Candida oxycetoniae]|uniref:KTI12 n=1 Tax=Candida oxycetoniae TaxID=497107 RepID=A0AAI9SVE1_9ASCO|nr:KTI12 [Candida oxycetoniae]KAI3403793.1 KTI12 [Candida oxycetoniae]